MMKGQCILVIFISILSLTCIASSRNPPPSYSFVHITDVHYDALYVNGGSFVSACHRRPDELVDADYTSVTKKKKKNKKKYNPTKGVAGKYGSPLSGCDSPGTLVNETFVFMAKYHAEAGVDFVVWTGDNARHDIDPAVPRTEHEVYSYNEYVDKLVSSTFDPTVIPIVPSLGNNDIPLHNVLPYHPDGSSPVLNFYAKLWAKYIPDDQIETFRVGGYFVRDVAPGLQVVGLNTLYLWSANEAVTECMNSESAGGAHLQWLEAVLNKARSDNQRVYLSGHVAPSELNFYPGCFKWFLCLSLHYNDVIAGSFYGHQNLDHFFFSVESREYHLIEREVQTLYRKRRSSSITPIADYFDSVNGKLPVLEDESRSRLNALADQLRAVPVYDVSSTGRNSPSWYKAYITYLFEQYERVSNVKGSKGKAQVVLVSPAVVPAYNPALRIYFYQPPSDSSMLVDETAATSSSIHTMQTTAYTIIDYKQYFINLTQGYIEDGGEGDGSLVKKPFFELEYSPKVAYRMTVAADTEDWIDFGGRMLGHIKNAINSDNEDEVAMLKDLFFQYFIVSSGIKIEQE